jgi:hypothetical protein
VRGSPCDEGHPITDSSFYRPTPTVGPRLLLQSGDGEVYGGSLASSSRRDALEVSPVSGELSHSLRYGPRTEFLVPSTTAERQGFS